MQESSYVHPMESSSSSTREPCPVRFRNSKNQPLLSQSSQVWVNLALSTWLYREYNYNYCYYYFINKMSSSVYFFLAVTLPLVTFYCCLTSLPGKQKILKSLLLASFWKNWPLSRSQWKVKVLFSDKGTAQLYSTFFTGSSLDFATRFSLFVHFG